MTIGLDILIWLIPLIVILIAVFILWLVTSIIRAKNFHEMSEEDINGKSSKKRKHYFITSKVFVNV